MSGKNEHKEAQSKLKDASADAAKSAEASSALCASSDENPKQEADLRPDRVLVSADPDATGPIDVARINAMLAASASKDEAKQSAEKASEGEKPAKQKKGKSSGGKKEPKLFDWHNLTYTSRVTMAFGFVAVMTALVAIGVLSFVWEIHFQTYTSENMRSLAASTATRIESEYQKTGTLFSSRIIAIAEYAESLSTGVGVMVIDNKTGASIYDSSQANISSSADINSAPNSLNGVETANIVVDGEAIGSVRVWVYGSEALISQADEEFRKNSYEAMVYASLLAIVLASGIGYLFARNLVRPINRMTTTAAAIKEGDLGARTYLTGEDEISRLGETFDAMADSIERDRELERRLTTDVAHELRTPLMAIRSTVEAMVDGVFEPDRERLETVNIEVRRLSRLVDAILKLSRLESRATPFKEDVLDIGELVQDIVITHEAYIVESGLRLSFSAEPQVMIRGDADMIRQATANLISNAVRYTPEGGQIAISVSGGDLMANIVVADSGIGLSPEEAKMVFSRFWRGDEGRQRESGGLGIGLSVVKEIVDRHGGWVQVEGRPGEGSRFTIHIPRYVPAAARTSGKATKIRVPRGSKQGSAQAKKKRNANSSAKK